MDKLEKEYWTEALFEMNLDEEDVQECLNVWEFLARGGVLDPSEE